MNTLPKRTFNLLIGLLSPTSRLLRRLNNAPRFDWKPLENRREVKIKTNSNKKNRKVLIEFPEQNNVLPLESRGRTLSKQSTTTATKTSMATPPSLNDWLTDWRGDWMAPVLWWLGRMCLGLDMHTHLVRKFNSLNQITWVKMLHSAKENK